MFSMLSAKSVGLAFEKGKSLGLGKFRDPVARPLNWWGDNCEPLYPFLSLNIVNYLLLN